ncbi:MAG: ABC transporter substrate-binding protein, partial [Eubacteriales bacterium]|nr:ABC transporter substrate-binding protein [Eubacteriales bacterium]
MIKTTKIFTFMLVLTIVCSIALLQSCSSLGAFEDNVDTEIPGVTEPDTTTGLTVDNGEREGGTLNLYISSVDTTNPLLTSEKYLSDVFLLVFESLIYLDKSSFPQPLIAKSWAISEDGLEWAIKLRDDVLWHDGIPLTSKDVEYTLDYILETKNGSVYKNKLANIEHYLSVDETTIKIGLKQPDSFFAEHLTFPIIKCQSYKVYEDKENSIPILPVGTGPFKFNELNTEEGILLEVNSSWWQSSAEGLNKGKPLIKFVSAKIYKEPPLEVMSVGNIDLAYIDNYNMSEFKEFNNTLLFSYPGRSYEFISFNTENKILESLAVRKAITSGIDRTGIIQIAAGGRAIPCEASILPGSWLFDEQDYTRYDGLPGLNELLVADGWTNKNSAWSKRIKGVNTFLKLELLVNNDSKYRQDIAAEIAKQLGELGIAIEVVPVKWDDLIKRLGEGKYDMAITGCVLPETSIVSELYTIDAESKSNNKLRNISRY